MATKFDDLVNTPDGTKELIKLQVTQENHNTGDMEKILRVAIEEQRRTYDWIDKSYDQLRLKILTILGGGLAALTFLYSTNPHFIPHQAYGQIFYFCGLGMVVMGLSVLVFALKPMSWEFSIEDRDLIEFPANNIIDYLEYTKKRHMLCYTINIRAYNFKQTLFNISLYPLIFGIIILVIIKLFN